MALIQKIHHAAYRCKDALETARWYEKYLGMKLILSIAEDQVPSTKEPDPYMHIFLDAGNGNVLAFFELPTRPPMGHDPNTPAWTQHLALEVASMEDLLATKERLEADGIVGSGTVSNKQGGLYGSKIENGGVGYCCIAEVRMYETIESGAPQTPFMRHGDTVEIAMHDASGASIFGSIRNRVRGLEK
ncbi:MAG: hypothetical protein PWQ19_1666 [Tepidiphilus sp.]|nr:hypothetical protein [Tepidiphilus sp.]